MTTQIFLIPILQEMSQYVVNLFLLKSVFIRQKKSPVYLNKNCFYELFKAQTTGENR